MKRKKRRELERSNTPDVEGQYLFNADSHEHVYLTDGRKVITLTKKDHSDRISSLINNGWIIVERPD